MVDPLWGVSLVGSSPKKQEQIKDDNRWVNPNSLKPLGSRFGCLKGEGLVVRTPQDVLDGRVVLNLTSAGLWERTTSVIQHKALPKD